jgi:phosphate transport system substrate-binding protein
MMSQIAGTYAAAYPLVELDVEMTGTADGFALFCEGMVEVTGASREMTARERESCTASGVQFLRLSVARDAIVLFTPGGFAEPQCLTREQIYALLGPESAGVDAWRDAGAVIPTAAAGLPAAPFVAAGPGIGSGTRQLLLDLAIEPVAEERGREAALRSDYAAQENQQRIVDHLAGSGLGFAGLATAAQ